MSLKDKGFRYLISPDRKISRWTHPLEVEAFYQDWSDHTDTPEKEFIEFLQTPIDAPSESK